MTRTTHGERIAVLEAIHAAAQQTSAEANHQVMERLDKLERHMNERFDKIEAEQGKQAGKIKEYEDKGKGFLIAAGVIGTAIGASLIAGLEKLLALFK